MHIRTVPKSGREAGSCWQVIVFFIIFLMEEEDQDSIHTLYDAVDVMISYPGIQMHSLPVRTRTCTLRVFIYSIVELLVHVLVSWTSFAAVPNQVRVIVLPPMASTLAIF